MALNDDFPTILTPEFRIHYPKVFEADSFNGGAMKWSFVMMFPKENEAELAEMKQLMAKAIEKKWSGGKPSGLRNPLRDGDEDRADKDEFGGMLFANAQEYTTKRDGSMKNRPPVLVADAQGNVVEMVDPSDMYAGCWCRAKISASAYDNMGNKGISFYYQSLFKVRDDEVISTGGFDAKSDYASFAAPSGGAGVAEDADLDDMFG
jgi:hypothetical protein